MATTKLCEQLHPKEKLMCNQLRGHLGKCTAWSREGKKYTWKPKDDGPDSLKELLRF